MRVEEAHLATEAPKYGLRDRPFDHAREFQNEVVEWVHDGVDPCAVLRAPTGAGKTATFHELIATRNLTLLVYPTNALLRQQRTRLENDGVQVKVLDSATLEGRGYDRTENLLNFVDRFAGNHEVVVTNPDILQAILQNMYRGDQAMRFFDRFDAIVYDEFHFYGPLAASGLLLQLKIIVERQGDPKVLLASATPNEDFIDFVRDGLGIPVHGISSTYAEEGDTFRKSVELVRHDERRILDRRDEVATALAEELETVSGYDQPHVVLVFNSARHSNEFHTFLAEEYPSVFEHAEKDNGFDTNDPQVALEDGDFYILNTTSKGEVGLDYDIETLYMENPGKPGQFLQRFGRAGRESEAEVHVYGLGQGPWSRGGTVAFPTFEQQIYEGLSEERMAEEWLADLIGFRAAYALAVREADGGWFNQELRADFADNVDKFDRWCGFIASVNEELDEIGGFGAKYTERSTAAKLLRFTERCFETFRGLRGRSLPAEIKYPRGDRFGLTTYDLVTTLRNYDIDHIEDDSILVLKTKDEDTLSVVTARLPEFETEPTKYDQPTSEIEDTLQTKIRRKIDEVALDDEFGVSTELLHRFYQIVRITNAVVPSRITTASFEIDVDTDGTGPPSITPRRRQL